MNKDKAHVICCNDSVEFVYISSEKNANQKKDELAQKYYDSCVNVMPKDQANYDLVDAKAKELIWQGSGTGYLVTKNVEKKEARIKEFVAEIMAKYPPGSIFKPVVALIALQEKVTTPSRYIYCPGFYTYNNDVRKCRNHPIATTVGRAIQYSCNSYFFQTFREIVELEGFYKPEPGLETFTKYLYQFGLGYSLGIDFPQEKEGNVPTVNYYNKLYPKNKVFASIRE